MIKPPAPTPTTTLGKEKAKAAATAIAKETEAQRFDRILARAEFKPLKAVFDHLDADALAKGAAINTTNSYSLFLAKLWHSRRRRETAS